MFLRHTSKTIFYVQRNTDVLTSHCIVCEETISEKYVRILPPNYECLHIECLEKVEKMIEKKVKQNADKIICEDI